MQKYPTPKKMLAQMELDPYYKHCALKGFHGHFCGGRVTREHAIIYASRRLNEYWAIVPICAKGHEVDAFQDAHTMNKDLNRWVALNRATDIELRSISKAIDYIRERDRLNKIYGVYKAPIFPDENIWGIKFDQGFIDEAGSLPAESDKINY